MSATALALVLTAAVLHALWNIAAKKASGNSHFALMSTGLVLVLWAPLGLWAAWSDVPHWGWLEWALVVASGLANLVYFNVLLHGYRVSDLTVVYPVARGTGPLISAFGAMLLLGEPLTALGLAGILGITFGVFMIAGGPALWRAAHDATHDAVRRDRVRAGVLYGAITGGLIAVYTLVDGYAVKVVLMSPILIGWFGNMARLPFLLPAALRDRAGLREAWRTQWGYALVVAAISPFAYGLVLYAVKTAPLSHVAPARELSMLFAALFAGSLLGEGDRGPRIAGAACIAAGVMALAFS